MKLLQVPTAILDERIKEELEENPALELSDDDHDDSMEAKDEFAEASVEDDYEESDLSSEDQYENIDISDYVQEGDDDIADYKLRDENYGDQEEKTTMPYKVETSFYEVLEAQLGMLKLDDREFRIAEQIIGSIDEDGYLRRETSAIVDDLAFRQNIDSNEEEVEGIIKRIQAFDPPGVAARTLQECLLLQLLRMKEEGKDVDIAIQALTKYFDEFTKKHYEKIQRGLNLNDDDLKEVMMQITKLNPKPGWKCWRGE